MNIEIAAKQLEALGNKTRLAIYRILVQAGEEGVTVGQIQSQLSIPGSTLSHHIAKLVQTDLAYQKRDSRTLYCHANYSNMDALLLFLQDNCCGKN